MKINKINVALILLFAGLKLQASEIKKYGPSFSDWQDNQEDRKYKIGCHIASINKRYRPLVQDPEITKKFFLDSEFKRELLDNKEYAALFRSLYQRKSW